MTERATVRPEERGVYDFGDGSYGIGGPEVIETIRLPDELGCRHVPVLSVQHLYDRDTGNEWTVYHLANSSPNAVIDTGTEMRWVNIREGDEEEEE